MDKCVICVAPHTSNWDLILGELVYTSLGRKASFLMKESWFFWPLGTIFRAIGGIAVPRRLHSGSLTDILTERFGSSARLNLAITPEGTRSRTALWHTGFLRIARQAGVPVILAAIDGPRKQVYIDRMFTPGADTEADMRAVKDYYKPFEGIKPDKFSAE